ncbi:MAG: hypothetical protein JWM35_858, partial [Verrucomicrobia bacterium]|nr:hypothetical protein [Verrucomicrobiota bacterium]
EFLSARPRDALREELDVQLAHLKMKRRMFDAPIDLPRAVDPNQNG